MEDSKKKFDNLYLHPYNEQKDILMCYNNKGKELNNLIIEKAKTGDRDSQEKIYSEFKDRIYTLALYYTKNPANSSDVTQDIFIKVFRVLNKFNGGNFRAWIYRVSINHLLNYVSRKQTFVDLKQKHLKTNNENIEEKIAIERILKKMPEKLSFLLILREKEGLDYKELSKVFGVSIGTIKSRLYKARKVFRNLYGGTDE
jgi:RNA polymerase sigma-70 factor (ECF subfamily)